MAANMYFTGQAAAAAQVDTFTPSVPDTSDEFSIRAVDDEGNDSTISFTVGATQTVKAVVEGLKAAADAAKAAGTAPWDEITATEDDAILTLTVNTAGKPIDYTAAATGGETLTEASVTANSGPYAWTTQANWDGGDADLPGADADDSVYIDGGESGASILYGLAQSGITVLPVIDIARCQVGQNGGVGEAPYYLAIKATKIDINNTKGVGTATLRAPVNINNPLATTFTIFDAGSNADDSTEPGVNILSANASTKAYIKKGNVGIANHSGETATFGEINVEGGKVLVGSGVTLTTLNQKGGDAVLRSACGTVDVTKGNLTTEGTGGITTKLTNRGGNVICNSSGTIAEVDALGGTTDFTQSAAPHIITLLKIGYGAVVKLNPARTTVTALQLYDAAGNLSIAVNKI